LQAYTENLVEVMSAVQKKKTLKYHLEKNIMSNFSRSPKLLKGALIEFSERFIGPVPNIILFQYNPESLTRTLSIWKTAAANDHENSESSRAQPFDPSETFTLSLELDAADALEKPELHPVSFLSGVADRIAAMEMLLYPQEESLLGGLVSALGGKSKPVPKGTVPVVMFAWGPGRIVPVRLTSFSVEEQAYSPQLYPIRAKVSIGLKILIPDQDFPKPKGYSEELAVTAYKFTRKQKQVLAASNTANNVESILGMLPF
jgi:hypothetical protein